MYKAKRFPFNARQNAYEYHYFGGSDKGRFRELKFGFVTSYCIGTGHSKETRIWSKSIHSISHIKMDNVWPMTSSGRSRGCSVGSIPFEGLPLGILSKSAQT